MSSVGEQVDPAVGPGGLRFRERGSICPAVHGSRNSGKERLRLPQSGAERKRERERGTDQGSKPKAVGKMLQRKEERDVRTRPPIPGL